MSKHDILKALLNGKIVKFPHLSGNKWAELTTDYDPQPHHVVVAWKGSRGLCHQVLDPETARRAVVL